MLILLNVFNLKKLILKKSKQQVLMLEINRLNDELKKLKRDQCQIELAKKVLNISENMCSVSF